MSGEVLKLEYDIVAEDFSSAGEASSGVKKTMKTLGISPEVIRKVAIAMYEAEINAVIHADGGKAYVTISPEKVEVVIEDRGPGIPNIDQAMQAGWSTAPENIREMGFGAGMGLPNMKRYTDEMFVESTVGVGTKVTLIVYIS
ncbi:MAG: anti-sigma regulatory factor [Ruminococcaceae bacterium]|nr:anti-sigma regulatory factor [Oscillospiraceae bacterium]